MRTTLTLDDDVARALEHRRAERGSTFRAVVNETLRAGIAALSASAPQAEPRRTEAVDLGRLLVPSLDDVEGVLSAVEGDQRQ